MKIGTPEQMVRVEPVQNPIPQEVPPADADARQGGGQDERTRPDEAVPSS